MNKERIEIINECIECDQCLDLGEHITKCRCSGDFGECSDMDLDILIDIHKKAF